MGGSFSSAEYVQSIKKFQTDELTVEEKENIDKFLESSSDFYNMFTSCNLSDFRDIKKAKPDNLIHLISHAVSKMHECATQHSELDNNELIQQLKGAINVLIRIVPLVFEDKDVFLRGMWREQAYYGNQINGIVLMESISVLLFKPGFTIMPVQPGVQLNYQGIDENMIWKSGISIPEAPNHYKTEYDQNRIALMRLMISLLSQPLYYAPDEYLLVLNPFSTFFTSRRAKNVKNLFVSLINLVISYDCQGYGLPYLSAIDQAGDSETMTCLALHLILILIEYKPPSIDNLRYLINGGHLTLNKIKDHFTKAATMQGQEDPTILNDLTINEHFRLLRVIHGKINLDPLYAGLSQYFQNIVDSHNTYLPNSVNQIPFYQEVSILMWRFMTNNNQVFEEFTSREDFHTKILIGVLLILDSSKKNPTKSNLMYLCIFILLTISSSRDLSMTLNQPYKLGVKFDMPPFEGTYADLIFLSIYKLIHNGPRLLKPIYKSIVAIIANIAPYTKQLCRESCDGLIYLVQVFSKKEFLLEKEDNCKTLTSLFETINYLIAYHDETNQYLQIQLMKHQTMFDYFDTNDFDLGINKTSMSEVASTDMAPQRQQQTQQQEETKQEESAESQEAQKEESKENNQQNEGESVIKSFLTNKDSNKDQQAADESEETKISSENTTEQQSEEQDDQLKKEDQDKQDEAEGLTKEISNLQISETKEEKSNGDVTNSKESNQQEKTEDKTETQEPVVEAQAQQQVAEPVYPQAEWFKKWKETLLLNNIKACIQHTYTKAMSFRNQMIEVDNTYASNQIVNIDEDQLAAYLQKFSLKGLLPQMPKILVTTYKGNESIDTWLISYLWGLIFVLAQEYQLYDHRYFKLFTINTYYQGQN